VTVGSGVTAQPAIPPVRGDMSDRNLKGVAHKTSRFVIFCPYPGFTQLYTPRQYPHPNIHFLFEEVYSYSANVSMEF
jgi:hypothetical protein